MIQTFTFPLPPTLNKIIASARSSPYISAKEKRKWTNLIAVSCWDAQPFPSQVWIEFKWKIKNLNSDPDNIAAAAKFVMDGLVYAGVIRDDSLKFVNSPILHWYEKGCNEVNVVVADFPIYLLKARIS